MSSRNTITFFDPQQKWGELSNFYVLNQPFFYKSNTYQTSEHLYHCLKYLSKPDISPLDERYADVIRNTNTPFKAKLLANKQIPTRYKWQQELKLIADSYNVIPRKDWDDVKIDMMMCCLEEKFNQNQHCKQVLLSTGDSLLIEGSKYDSFWGIGNGNGKNHLGRLLMKLRERMKSNLSGKQISNEPKN